MENTAYLVLENGDVFPGISFGAPANEKPCEVVFTGAMTGYLATLTDKSYYGQTVVQAFPLIGNCGVIPEDFESERIHACGYVVKELCACPSDCHSEKTLDAFLREQNVPGLCGVDTHALTQALRRHGVMNGIITADPQKINLDALKSYRIKYAVENVSIPKATFIAAQNKQYRTVIWDFGYKEALVRELLRSNCDVCVLPYNASASEIASLEPDGILLSDGPGDPAENQEILVQLEKMLHFQIPIFGIGLGHQLLALAHGLKTEKMKCGHRGLNIPVRDMDSGRIYITAQNHGYAVVNESVDPDIAESWYMNVDDGSCEGLVYRNTPSCSVQFRPEACAGPQDTNFLFYRFSRMMEVRKNATQRTDR